MYPSLFYFSYLFHFYLFYSNFLPSVLLILFISHNSPNIWVLYFLDEEALEQEKTFALEEAVMKTKNGIIIIILIIILLKFILILVR